MNNLFTQEVGLQAWVVMAVAVLLLAILGAMIWTITSIRELKAPKFGFGGKPRSIIGIILLAFLIPASVYVVQQRIDVAQQAASLNDVSMTVFEINDLESTSEVSFSATPIVKGKAWGENQQFKLAWTITGPETIIYTEEDRGTSYPSYFVDSLKKGTYTVTVRVTGEDLDITKSTILTLD